MHQASQHSSASTQSVTLQNKTTHFSRHSAGQQEAVHYPMCPLSDKTPDH